MLFENTDAKVFNLTLPNCLHPRPLETQVKSADTSKKRRHSKLRLMHDWECRLLHTHQFDIIVLFHALNFRLFQICSPCPLGFSRSKVVSLPTIVTSTA